MTDTCELTTDAAGRPLLLSHTCAECGHTKRPDQQDAFDGASLLAVSNCPCGTMIVTLMGDSEFVEFMKQELAGEPDFKLCQTPVPPAVEAAFRRAV